MNKCNSYIHVYTPGDSKCQCGLSLNRVYITQPKMTKEDIRRDKYYRKKYSVTLEWYNTQLEKQNNSCAICKRHESTFKRRLSLDHDHKTGEARGLLCFFCNKRVVGRHTKESVLKLVDYLLPGKKVV